MEKEINKLSQEKLERASTIITQAVHKSMFEHFDVFAHLLSTIVWQSSTELCIKLIEMKAPEEWESLQDEQGESIEIRRQKESHRK